MNNLPQNNKMQILVKYKNANIGTLVKAVEICQNQIERQVISELLKKRLLVQSDFLKKHGSSADIKEFLMDFGVLISVETKNELDEIQKQRWEKTLEDSIKHYLGETEEKCEIDETEDEPDDFFFRT